MNAPKTINLDAIPTVNEAARANRAMGAIVGSSALHKGANWRKPSRKMRQRKAQAAKKAREARRLAGTLAKPALAVREIPKLRVVNSSLGGGVVTYSDGSIFRFFEPVQERPSFDYDDE